MPGTMPKKKPSAAPRRDALVAFLAEPDLKARIREAAAADGRTVSDFLHRLVGRALPPPEVLGSQWLRPGQEGASR